MSHKDRFLNCGEISLFEVDQEETEEAKARLEALSGVPKGTGSAAAGAGTGGQQKESGGRDTPGIKKR